MQRKGYFRPHHELVGGHFPGEWARIHPCRTHNETSERHWGTTRGPPQQRRAALQKECGGRRRVGMLEPQLQPPSLHLYASLGFCISIRLLQIRKQPTCGSGGGSRAR